MNAKYDVILVHAPSVYDFRDRDDVLFAYLSNSDGAHVSPIFEMPPVGIFALLQHLQKNGFSAQFFNVASQMLRDPAFNVETFFERVPASFIGIDLHWLVHAHGALELTRLYKEIHPGAKTIIGGIASTYYHEELIMYPQIDYVVRGYDTLLPVELLVRSGNAPEMLGEIPNLTWKDGGQIRCNQMTYTPAVYSAAVDWRKIFSRDRKGMTPYNLVIPQAGCEYNCKWCGGSRYFFSKYMGLEKGRTARIQKEPTALKQELASISEAVTDRHTVTMIDFWHEYPALFDVAADIFLDDKIKSVHFSLHRLPSIEKGKRMAAPVDAVIELSPDSHDFEISKASGRGTYTMQQMEDFIDALLDDVYSFEIYFMLGLPRQTAASIRETVDYSEHVLRKYRGKRVTPYICPMLPFLDPGSEIYDHPQRFGYRIFHRTLEDHRKALVEMNWKDRLNYETQWLSREELVNSSYEAVRALTLLKKQYGVLPKSIADSIVVLIDETRDLLGEITAYQVMPDGPEKQAAHAILRKKILEYNRRQLKAVRSQQRPFDLGFAKQQWFDTEEAFSRVLAPTVFSRCGAD
jgi:clorobiocin biosynthesis protein CloN6